MTALAFRVSAATVAGRSLRRLAGWERRRLVCVGCGHALYYHRIDSGAGECFVRDVQSYTAITIPCPCEGASL